MFIEINLLPKRPKKNIATLFSIIFFIIIITIALGFIYLYVKDIKSQTEQTSNIAHQVQLERIKVEKEIKEKEEKNEVNDTDKELITIINDTVYTSNVINGIQQKLPLNGKLRNYSYSEGTLMSVTLHVDESYRIGKYAEDLETIKWISEAKVNSINADKEKGFIGTLTLTIIPSKVPTNESGVTE